MHYPQGGQEEPGKPQGIDRFQNARALERRQAVGETGPAIQGADQNRREGDDQQDPGMRAQADSRHDNGYQEQGMVEQVIAAYFETRVDVELLLDLCRRQHHLDEEDGAAEKQGADSQSSQAVVSSRPCAMT